MTSSVNSLGKFSQHHGIKTYVVKTSGKNRGAVGYIRGSFADRIACPDTRKTFVFFPNRPFPDDFIVSKLETLREATRAEIIFEGFEP